MKKATVSLAYTMQYETNLQTVLDLFVKRF